MALSRKQIAMIHVAKKQLGLCDEDYRAILLHEAGVDTSRDLDSDGLDAVMQRFKVLGFKPSTTAPYYGKRAGMATSAQIAFLRSLWAEYTDGEGDDRSLGKWLQRDREGLRPAVRELRCRPEGNHRTPGDGGEEGRCHDGSPPPIRQRLSRATQRGVT